MKKIAFMLCAAAVLGAMSSCTSDSDATIRVKSVSSDETRVLMVTSNAPAIFTYGDKTVSGTTTATFENVPEKGTLMIKPLSDDYFGQEKVAVAFNGSKTIALDVQLAKKPTIEVSQEDMMNGKIVTNDAENREMTGVLASIAVPSTTTITGNTTSPFSISTFVPTESSNIVTRGDDDGAAGVLVMRCAADGAKFSEPVVVTLDIPESDGLDLACVSEDGTEVYEMPEAGNGKRLVRLSHFSDWTVVMRATATDVVTRATTYQYEITTKTVSVKQGDNTISYQSKTGAVWTGGTKNTTVTNYLKNKVGKYVVTTKTKVVEASGDGTYTYRVKQAYLDKTYTSGSAKFTARVYYGAEVEDEDLNIPQGGHSGGGYN